MVIPIASDHAGFPAKELIKKYLEELDHMPIDYGTHSEDSVDYPDYAVLVANAVGSGDYTTGIVVCGSGQGVCMTANKVDGVRAALPWNSNIAKMSQTHNDANVLCIAGRYIDETTIKEMVAVWLETKFEGGRHQKRVEKISTVVTPKQ